MRNNYQPSKVDANQPGIVKAFRKLGYYVKHVHEQSHFVDIIVMKAGVVAMVEIKDNAKVPSARKLTPGEQKFRDAWTINGGNWFLVEGLEDVFTVDKFYKEQARDPFT